MTSIRLRGAGELKVVVWAFGIILIAGQASSGVEDNLECQMPKVKKFCALR